MNFIFIFLTMLWIGGLFASPLEEIKLSKGMKREKAEELIAKALGKKSRYNIYSMNREQENKYHDDEKLLIVKYKPGFPAPWIKKDDGTSQHLPPIDSQVESWELLKIQINNTELKKILKTHSSTSNEYATAASLKKFFSKNRRLTDQALTVLKPYLQKEEPEAWKYFIVFIKNPGFTQFGNITVNQKTKKITQADFMWKKYIKTQPKKIVTMTSEQAYQVLAKTKLFGFGVKLGQRVPRDTDEAYQTILNDLDNKKIFLKLLDEKNIYSKLFALCALFHLDHKAYLERILLLDKNKKINSRSGCVLDEVTVGTIIKNIQNSKYEYMHKPPN